MAEERSGAGTGALLRQLLPWLLAAAILGLLLWRVPLSELRAALERTSLPLLGLLAAGFVTATLAADALALWVSFRRSIPGTRISLGATALMRGASYLLQLLSYGAGQGGLVWFLRRRYGIGIAAGAGAVLLATGVFLIVIAAAVGLGLWLGAVPSRPELRWLSLMVAAGIPIYLAIIWRRPRFLARVRLLAPLFDAGILGTVEVALARTLHIAVLIAGHLLAMRLFGIDVPIAAAISRLPVVFVVGSLPLSPSGLGTTQAAAVTLFAEYAPGDDAAAQEAVVLAYSLAFQMMGSVVMALGSLGCLRALDRTKPLTSPTESA